MGWAVGSIRAHEHVMCVLVHCGVGGSTLDPNMVRPLMWVKARRKRAWVAACAEVDDDPLEHIPQIFMDGSFYE